MKPRTRQITTLLIKHLHGELTPAGREELELWAAESELKRSTFNRLNDSAGVAEILAKRASYDKSRIAQIIHQDFPQLNLSEQAEPEKITWQPTHRIHFLKTAWLRWAAIILLTVSAAAYYFFHTSHNKPAVVQHTPPPILKDDVNPGSNKAILILSNGQQVQLNNAASETINDGTLSIENSNGQLIYDHPERGSLSPAGGSGATGAEGGSPAGRTATNTMSTPNGGQYKLTLSDGTKVWLNAASSISYPIAFTQTTRQVTITGEVYFEVAKNKSKPFIVITPKEKIEVLGTSFNTNYYPDQPDTKLSLLEGAVKVNNHVLKPGEAFTKGKVQTTNITQDIAWKNGIFNFQDMDLQQAMRQLARWYDIEIRYEGNMRAVQFAGAVGRSLTLQQVLRGLEGIDDLHFKLEGKTLTVIM